MSKETQVMNAAGEKVGDTTLAECTFAHATLIEEFRVGAGVGAVLANMKNTARAAFILATPLEETRKLVLEGGGALEIAVDKFAGKFKPAQALELAEGIGRILQRSSLWGAGAGGEPEKNSTQTATSPASPPSPQ